MSKTHVAQTNQIEEKKRLHAELRSKLNALGEPIDIVRSPQIRSCVINEHMLLQRKEPFQPGPELPFEWTQVASVPSVEQEVLNIVVVAAECAPYSKTGIRQSKNDVTARVRLGLSGGLADVVGALPKSLSALGHRVMVISPRYQPYPETSFTGVQMHYRVFGALHEAQTNHHHSCCDDLPFLPRWHTITRLEMEWTLCSSIIPLFTTEATTYMAGPDLM